MLVLWVLLVLQYEFHVLDSFLVLLSPFLGPMLCLGVASSGPVVVRCCVGANAVDGVVCHGGITLVSCGVYLGVDDCISSTCNSRVSPVLCIASWIALHFIVCRGRCFFVAP